MNINTDFTLDSVWILLYLSAYYDKIITIDNFNTRINDDGISFKKDGNNFIIGIHIADVASWRI